jgi:hypothetical protein
VNICPAVESIFQREGAKVCGKFADHHMDDHESSEAQAIDSGFLRVFAPSRLRAFALKNPGFYRRKLGERLLPAEDRVARAIGAVIARSCRVRWPKCTSVSIIRW